MPLLNNQIKLGPLLLFWIVQRPEKIYIYKKLIKGTNVPITESLTAHRVVKLKEPKEKFGLKNVWSNDSRIICKDHSDDKTKIYFD